jgi:hypothetical protein
VDDDFRQELLVKRKEARAMANWNKLTEGQYKAIKTLLRGGATQKEASEYMQVSSSTAFLVAKAETYEEYQHMNAERQLEQHKRVAAIKAKEAEKTVAQATPAQPASQVVEYRQNVTIQATHYMMQELQKMNETLSLISRKLAFIVDDLCGTGKKEG